MDAQEHASHRPRTPSTGLPRGEHPGGPDAQGDGLQSSVQSKDHRRQAASRSERPIRVHRQTCQGPSAEVRAVDIGGHEKEGSPGKSQEFGKSVAEKEAPIKVETHDFPKKELGKAVPYGVYDLQLNEAVVSVGISHDTAQFAVAAIRRWWTKLGKKRYPYATRLLITADSGGSNSPRTRLWRVELQKLADALGLIIEVCHYPPGTSKWNKIEHKLFCHITRNWQGVPLETFEIVVNLIAATRTETGLEVHAWIDEKEYPDKLKVSDEELAEVRIHRNRFHGEWNYEIRPRTNKEIR